MVRGGKLIKLKAAIATVKELLGMAEKKLVRIIVQMSLAAVSILTGIFVPLLIGINMSKKLNSKILLFSIFDYWIKGFVSIVILVFAVIVFITIMQSLFSFWGQIYDKKLEEERDKYNEREQ